MQCVNKIHLPCQTICPKVTKFTGQYRTNGHVFYSLGSSSKGSASINLSKSLQNKRSCMIRNVSNSVSQFGQTRCPSLRICIAFPHLQQKYSCFSQCPNSCSTNVLSLSETNPPVTCKWLIRSLKFSVEQQVPHSGQIYCPFGHCFESRLSIVALHFCLLKQWLRYTINPFFLQLSLVQENSVTALDVKFVIFDVV